MPGLDPGHPRSLCREERKTWVAGSSPAMTASSKPRRALFCKRLDAFPDLGAAHAVAMAPVGGGFIELAAGEFIDGALHAGHRDRRIAGEDRGELVDFLIQRLHRHHCGEIAYREHFRRGYLLRGQEQFFGIVGAEPRHVAGDPAPVIMQAQPRCRHEHLGRIDADPEIACQRQIGRAAIDAAVKPADRRHRKVFQPVDGDLEGRARAVLFERAGRAFGDRIEIIAGAESAAGAGQHQYPDREIGLDPVEQFLQRVEVVGLQPVQMLRPVEADGGAVTGDIEQRRAGAFRIGHEALLYLFSSARRLASASMVSARSGCRAISRRKSTRSSTSSRDSRVVVILAERTLLPSSGISPKKAPSPSATFLPGRSTSTSPSAMKYMQSPCWPLRMIMVRAGRSMVRSICVTSAIAAGPSVAKNGTLLTVSQVFRKLSRRVSAANPVAKIPVQSPNTPRPEIMTRAETMRPSGVIGTTSPYPVVVIVTTAHHSAAGTLPKVAGWTSRSRKYSATEARNTTIRKITSTLSSGPDSTTSTRRSWRNPGIPGTSFSTQATPNSHADLGFAPAMRASGMATAATPSTSPWKDRV